jgi:lipopolysaccharide export system protein LptC
VIRDRSLLEKTRAWLPVLPLLLLVLATWWLDQQVQPLPQKQSQQRHDLDYAIDRFSAVTLDQQGLPRHLLSAERLWHYPDDDTTHLQMPQFTSMAADRPPMRTSAQTGMLTSKGDDIYLYDEVRIVRPLGGGLGEQRFATDYLHLVPDRDWADTDQSVVVSSPHSTLRAVGMELDNQARTVKLLSRVRANHEPIR